MRTWAAHAVFAAILFGSLVTRERAADPFAGSVSFKAAVLRVAGSHGWAFDDYRATRDMVSWTLVLEAPGCSQPVLVSLRLSSFEDETMMQYALEPGYVRRYVYFDRTWDAPDHWAAFLQRMKYEVLAKFGMTEYLPSDYLLLVEAPSRCQAAETIDWRPVWSRDTLATAQANATATAKYQQP
jgi:hypothetical protein